MIDFEVLKTNNDFMIEKKYPHRIWNIKRKEFCNEYHKSNGWYVVAKLGWDDDRKRYITASALKRYLIATQWIENPNNFRHVKRISEEGVDTIDNLMWYKPKSGPSKGTIPWPKRDIS